MIDKSNNTRVYIQMYYDLDIVAAKHKQTILLELIDENEKKKNDDSIET
jgi:hypothetical protein